MTMSKSKDDEPRTDVKMRLVISGAADTLTVYALCDAFDWERDIDILRPILQGIEKLQTILDAQPKFDQLV